MIRVGRSVVALLAEVAGRVVLRQRRAAAQALQLDRGIGRLRHLGAEQHEAAGEHELEKGLESHGQSLSVSKRWV